MGLGWWEGGGWERFLGSRTDVKLAFSEEKVRKDSLFFSFFHGRSRLDIIDFL